MKRIITAVAVIVMMAATSFSQTTEKKKSDNEIWLDSYECLIKRMNKVNPQVAPTDSIDKWRYERACIRTEYKDIYKDFLTDAELKRYFSLNAQYSKYFTKYQFNETSEKLNDTFGDDASELGNKVADGAKKVGTKISGWFQGLKK